MVKFNQFAYVTVACALLLNRFRGCWLIFPNKLLPKITKVLLNPQSYRT